MKAWMSSNFGQILPPTSELSALAHLKKLMYNVVNTSASLFDGIFFIFSSPEPKAHR